MPNIIDQMEERIFQAQMARLTRLTGKTVDAAFIREMYDKVKERYAAELERRKIRLRALDGARLDEVVSYIFYFHVFAGVRPHGASSASSRSFKSRAYSLSICSNVRMKHL